LLAMVVNDNDGNQDEPGDPATIASKLAPTGDHTVHRGNLHFSNVSSLNKSFVQPGLHDKTGGIEKNNDGRFTCDSSEILLTVTSLNRSAMR